MQNKTAKTAASLSHSPLALEEFKKEGEWPSGSLCPDYVIKLDIGQPHGRNKETKISLGSAIQLSMTE